MYSHISTCIEGMEVIRTCNMQQEMIAKFDNLQDGFVASLLVVLWCVFLPFSRVQGQPIQSSVCRHSSAYRLFWCAYRWTMLRMDWMTSTYYSVCIVVALVLPLDGQNRTASLCTRHGGYNSTIAQDPNNVDVIHAFRG